MKFAMKFLVLEGFVYSVQKEKGLMKPPSHSKDVPMTSLHKYSGDNSKSLI
jgi:hypothetical protein